MNRIGLVIVLFLFVGAGCVLLPDVYCNSDADCPGKRVCFVSHQCVPPWWVEQVYASKDASTEPIFETKVETPKETCAGSCVLGDIQGCFTGKMGCQNTVTGWKCEGICKEGTQKCVILKQGECPQWDICQGAVLPQSKENCDQLDNNCDGRIDEGCQCKDDDTQSCYTKGAGCVKNGSSFSCSAPCVAGTQKCVNGRWGSCDGEVGPQTEMCDGVDNDCNGKVDDISNPPKCTNQSGVCSGSVKRCGGSKGWLACVATDFGKGYEVTETSCDTADNDCDGKVDEGCVVTVAGNGNGDVKDGAAAQAEFLLPTDLTFDKVGQLYISGLLGGVVRKLDLKGNVSLVVGGGPLSGDGPALQVSLVLPWGLAFDALGKLFICESDSDFSSKVRLMDSRGGTVIVTGAGAGDKEGMASVARFRAPKAIVFDMKGNLYISDSGNHKIKKLDTLGKVTTVAGSGTKGDNDGFAWNAEFHFPVGLALDKAGNLFIADSGNHLIRKLDLKGNVTTVAGTGSKGAADGQALQASFSEPNALAFDKAGNLYISDTGNHVIRKLDTSGNVTTVAGSGSVGFLDDSALKAKFNEPRGLAFDKNGDLYIADSSNHRIRKLILP
jgi:sugar lactone lactonase YvrE